MTFRSARGRPLRALLLALGLLVFCKPVADPSALEVEYRGCWAFYLPDQVCALYPAPNHRLHLWVSPPKGTVEIHAGGRLLSSDGKEVSGGRYYKLEIPKQADRLTVSVLLPDGSPGQSWSLRLKEAEQPWTDKIRQNSKNPDNQTLMELLSSSPIPMRGWFFGLLAQQARNAGDSDREKEYLLAGRAADLSANCWSEVAKKSARLADLYIGEGLFNDAQRILDLDLPYHAPMEGQYFVAFGRALLAQAAGDYRLALEQIRKADEWVEHLEMAKYRESTEQLQALIFKDLGRSQDASRLFERLLGKLTPEPSDPCAAGEILTNAGWFWLMEHEADKDAKNPVPTLERALAELKRGSCVPQQQLTAHLNLALAYQQQDRWPAAQWELDQARALAKHAGLAELLWQDALEARAAINENRAANALLLYEDLERKSKLAASPAGVVQALLGQAKARLALNQRKKAISVLDRAELKIEEQSRHIPVHKGLDTFFAYQEAATRFHLRLLLADGQQQSAFELARRSRSRLLRQLAVKDQLNQLSDEDQKSWFNQLSTYRALRNAVDREAKDRWKLAGSEQKRAQETESRRLKEAQDALDSVLKALPDTEGKLSPPGRDEVILAYHPLSRGKWVAFASTLRGLEIAYPRIPAELPAEEDLARILLEPFRSAIKASRNVRVLPYGALLRTVDFHALPFDGEPLLATHLVTYSLDLPLHASPPPGRGRPVALVVSNPTSDLRTAEGEGQAVAAAIQRWPGAWKVESLTDRAAESEQVLAALSRSSFFHYAGHGKLSGFAGWSSELPLANNTRLALIDVLSLTPAPDWIVLSACDAARTSEEAPGEGVGLANAFLLAGSRGVVAARKLVPDQSAPELMRELYSRLGSGEDLPSQFRQAQLACRAKGPSVCPSWASFRLLTP